MRYWSFRLWGRKRKDWRRLETVWYLFVEIETRRGLEREALWSDSTFEVIVAEYRNVRLE